MKNYKRVVVWLLAFVFLLVAFGNQSLSADTGPTLDITGTKSPNGSDKAEVLGTADFVGPSPTLLVELINRLDPHDIYEFEIGLDHINWIPTGDSYKWIVDFNIDDPVDVPDGQYKVRVTATFASGSKVVDTLNSPCDPVSCPGCSVGVCIP
ncbi:MAG: hypothetical protein L0332_15060 [Chloroflexi bacterium]|nr:hypothetical protein [Chloroflexota bacterium]MCI0579277.1 hypothetical protein [Chloroflexota bacterium]MCI0644362.1 hypothetical protein [Chloroflexota bacterium]MCI0728021.1 hypothetical protein [Chloroflexota bacterium]